jgi:Lysozyme like domain
MAARLTYAQLEGVWIKAGGSAKLAPLMAAIAEAESRGDPDAVNRTDNGGTQTSWGLWQISNGTHGEVSPRWADPVVNARLARAKLKGQGLSAWGTYDSGAYKRFLSGSTTPDPNIPGTSGGAGASASGASHPTCQIFFSLDLGKVTVPIIPGVFHQTIGETAGGVCLLSKPQARAIAGLAFLIAGGLVIIAGLLGAIPASRRSQLGDAQFAALTRGGGAPETPAAPATARAPWDLPVT